MKRVEFIISLLGVILGTGLVVKYAAGGQWFTAAIWLVILGINIASAWDTRPRRESCKCCSFQRVGWCGDRMIMARQKDPNEPKRVLILFNETAKLQCNYCGRVSLRRIQDVTVEWADKPADWTPDND